nr:MAG TPA: hypothetical protein [Caudoviricetes sp.]
MHDLGKLIRFSAVYGTETVLRRKMLLHAGTA